MDCKVQHSQPDSCRYTVSKPWQEACTVTGSCSAVKSTADCSDANEAKDVTDGLSGTHDLLIVTDLLLTSCAAVTVVLCVRTAWHSTAVLRQIPVSSTQTINSILAQHSMLHEAAVTPKSSC